MTKEDLKLLLQKLDIEYQQNKRRVFAKYALFHNPYKIGDIVSDHKTTIKIEKIGTSVDYGNQSASCVYSGVQLKKDGTPTIKQNDTTVYQSNIPKN